MSPGRLFPPDHYYLQYALPRAPFPVRVRLDSAAECRRCYAAMGALTHGRRLRLAESPLDGFKLVPRREGAPVFDFEPEDLVKVRSGVGPRMRCGQRILSRYGGELDQRRRVAGGFRQGAEWGWTKD